MLWVYKMMARAPTRETPFRLAYGSEVVIPAEVRLTSYRVENHDESRNDEAMRLQFNLVDEVRATTEQRLVQFRTSWPSTTIPESNTWIFKLETLS